MKEFTNIFMTQVQMLEQKSKEQQAVGKGLELADLRKLESLAKAWRTYQGSEIDSSDVTLQDMTAEEIKKALSRLNDEPEIQPNEEFESERATSEEQADSGTVAKG